MVLHIYWTTNWNFDCESPKYEAIVLKLFVNHEFLLTAQSANRQMNIFST
jgi:hypothetical protein